MCDNVFRGKRELPHQQNLWNIDFKEINFYGSTKYMFGAQKISSFKLCFFYDGAAVDISVKTRPLYQTKKIQDKCKQMNHVLRLQRDHTNQSREIAIAGK